MEEIKSYFVYTDDAENVDMEANEKICKGIWGKPGKIHGVYMKESHCLMRKSKSGAVKFIRIRNVNELYDYIQKSAECKEYNLYIGRDTYINHAVHFSSETHFSCKNICIDIDNHDADPEEVCHIVNIFLTDLLEHHEEYGIPMPNAAVYTGRGIQIWYYLESASAKLQKIVSKTAETLCKKINAILADSPLTYADFEIDFAASKRACGLSRLPGSYNPNAKCFSQGICLSNKRWDLNELKDKVGVPAPESRCKNTKQRKNKSRKNVMHGRGRFIFLLLNTLKQAAEQGDYTSREVLCHVYHAVMLMYGIEKAEEKVNELNHLFKNPLPEKQIQYLVQCNNKYHYRYSEATIFEYIGISEMRVAEYYKKKENLYSVRDYKQENAKRDQERLEKRVHWHNRIRTLAQEGYSVKEICKMTGRCLQTVKKYIDTPMEDVTRESEEEVIPEVKPDKEIKAQPVRVSELDRKRRAVQLYKQRFRTVSIARIMAITKEQAEIYTAEYRKYRKNRGSIKTAAYDLGMLHRRIQSYFQVGTRLVSEREGITKTRLLSLMEELNDLQNKRYEQEKRLRNIIPKKPEGLPELKVMVSNLKDGLQHWLDRWEYELLDELL